MNERNVCMVHCDKFMLLTDLSMVFAKIMNDNKRGCHFLHFAQSGIFITLYEEQVPKFPSFFSLCFGWPVEFHGFLAAKRGLPHDTLNRIMSIRNKCWLKLLV